MKRGEMMNSCISRAKYQTWLIHCQIKSKKTKNKLCKTNVSRFLKLPELKDRRFPLGKGCLLLKYAHYVILYSYTGNGNKLAMTQLYRKFFHQDTRHPADDAITLYQFGPVPMYTIKVAIKPKTRAYTIVSLKHDIKYNPLVIVAISFHFP